MPRFAANLHLMFNEVPFLDRFEAAARAGFAAVEFLFPYEHPPEAIAERLRANGLTQALFTCRRGISRVASGGWRRFLTGSMK